MRILRSMAANKKPEGLRLECGGVEGDRTLDLRIANATLSQLSYHPTKGADCTPMPGAPQTSVDGAWPCLPRIRPHSYHCPPLDPAPLPRL